MFRSREDLIAEAYRLQEQRIAYDPGTAIPTDASTFKSTA